MTQLCPLFAAGVLCRRGVDTDRAQLQCSRGLHRWCPGELAFSRFCGSAYHLKTTTAAKSPSLLHAISTVHVAPSHSSCRAPPVLAVLSPLGKDGFHGNHHSSVGLASICVPVGRLPDSCQHAYCLMQSCTASSPPSTHDPAAVLACHCRNGMAHLSHSRWLRCQYGWRCSYINATKLAYCYQNGSAASTCQVRHVHLNAVLLLP